MRGEPTMSYCILSQRKRSGAGRLVGAVLALALLGGCGLTDEWFGDAEAPPLPGQRISVIIESGAIEPDARLADLDVLLPPPYLNAAWPQAGGNAAHAMHHLQVADGLTQAWSRDFGAGSEGDQRILSGPVSANGLVFTMDRDFMIRAWRVDNGQPVWTYDPQVPEEDEEAFGGGLAYDEGKLFASTGFAQLIAIDAAQGTELWRANLPGPMRAAPTAGSNTVVAITIDNQATAFNATTGEQAWTHSGFSETAGLLGGASPAIDGNMVVVPYSSGELFALRLGTGRSLWSDTLTTVRRVDTLSTLADIRGLPIIDRGVVYAVSHAGRTVALDARTGGRVWDQQLGGLQSPWIAGEFVYFITTEGNLLCLTRRGGRVKWVSSLPVWEDPEDRQDPISWVGPVLAGDRLLLANNLGEVWAVSPYDGKALGKIDVGSAIRVPPIVANGTVFVQTENGSLLAYR